MCDYSPTASVIVSAIALVFASYAVNPQVYSERSEYRTLKDQNQLASQVGRLKNDDVLWQGSYLGFLPTLSDRAAKFRGVKSKPLRDALIEGTGDVERYIVCHYLLTEIYGSEMRLQKDSISPPPPRYKAEKYYDFSDAEPTLYESLVNKDGKYMDYDGYLVDELGFYIDLQGNRLPGYDSEDVVINGLSIMIDDDFKAQERSADALRIYKMWKEQFR